MGKNRRLATLTPGHHCIVTRLGWEFSSAWREWSPEDVEVTNSTCRTYCSTTPLSLACTVSTFVR